jgi:hypothetical protein
MFPTSSRAPSAIIICLGLALFAAVGAYVSLGDSLSFDISVRNAVHRASSPFLTTAAFRSDWLFLFRFP